MKNQSNFLNRILAILLVFLIALTGLLSFVSSSIDVSAFGGADAGLPPIVSGGGTSGNYPEYLDSGWRISLMETRFRQDESPLKKGSIFSDPKNQLATADLRTSIIVTSSTYQNIVSLFSNENGVHRVVNERVGKMSDIFKTITDAGLDLDPCGPTLTTYGKLCPEYWNDVFEPYVRADKAKAINEFLAKFGHTIDSIGIDANNACFVIEPVTFWRNGSIAAIGWLDCFNMNGSGISSVFDTFMNEGTGVTDTAEYLISSGTSKTAYKLRYQSSFVNYCTVYGTDIHRDIKSADPNVNGYVVVGHDVKVDNPGKASATYSLFYEGNSSQSGKGLTVKHSTNIIGKNEYGTINYNLSPPSSLSGNAKDLKSWSWGDTVGNDKSPEKAGENLVKRVTGLKSEKWTDEDGYKDYINVTAGVRKIDFEDANGKSTEKIVTAVNNTVNDIKNISIVSSATTVGGGNINVGKTYNLKLENKEINGIVSEVASKLSYKGVFTNTDSPKKVVGSGNYSGSMKNIATNFSLRALDCGKELKSISKDKFTTNSDSKFGVSVTLMAKKQNVTSYIAYATLDRETGEITYGNNDKHTYDVSESSQFTVPDNMNKLCVYAIVPNNSGYTLKDNRNGSNIYKKADVNMSSSAGLKDAFTKAGVTNVVDFGFISKGQTINVGCADGSSGYSILVLQLVGNVTHKSELSLYDYELNYLYPSMLTDRNYASLLNYVSYKKTGSETLTSGCLTASSDIYETSANKTIKASTNYAGNIISRNKNLGDDKNILQFDGYTGGIFTTEYKARTGYTFTSNLTNVKFSLAVNLVRGDFDSKVTVSTISNQTIDTDYAKKNIGLKFGNIPSGTVNASSRRSSDATIGDKLKDTFEWNIKYTITDSTYAYSLVKNKKTCPGHVSTSDGVTSISHCAPLSYNRIVSTEIPGSFDGTRIKYVVSETAYKYQTDTIATAKNTTQTVATSLQTPVNGLNNSSSVIAVPYKIAVVNSSDKTLGFYPEVKMRAYSSTGDKITGSISTGGTNDNRVSSGSVVPHTVKVLGEIKRTLKPSSMYTIKVTSPSGKAITGTTTSDSFAVGSSASNVSGGLPVIYAGGDVSLNVTPNFKLNMYGYSLDLVEKTDTVLKGTGNYSTVVADSSKVKTLWGNDASYKPLDDFNSWITNTLDKLSVDTTLTVNGSGVNKTYNNFASSIGNLGTNTAEAEGVYNIRIEKGAIVDDGGYQALINQIKLDYNCPTSQAKTIFENSAIYKTIIDAVEDCNDSFNASRKSNAIDSSRNHWYDEEVKTFVIRRYKKEDIAIKNILVNDKIDYGAAPTSSTTSDSSDSLKKATAKWYLTLYFKELPTGFTTGTTLYDPKNYSGLSNANTAGTVLVNECYISGADFVVPSSSTNDMGN